MRPPTTPNPHSQAQESTAEEPSPGLERAQQGAAGFIATLFFALITWWTLKAGAFFPSVYLPGSIVLYLSLAMLLVAAPMPLALGRDHKLALVALSGFALWTGVSIIWSPAQDVAVEDTMRTLIYPAAFFAGLCITALLPRRPALPLAAWGLAAIVIAVVTCMRILGADGVDGLIDSDGTLSYPLGYRNANAFFFIISAFLLIGLAARTASRLAVQGLAGAGASACIAITVLCQSRGSVLAAAAGALALLLLFPFKLRLIAMLLAAIAPVGVIIRDLLDPFSAASAGPSEAAALVPMQEAAEVILLAAVAAGLLSIIASRMLDQVGVANRGSTLSGRALAGGALALIVAAAALFLVVNPLEDGLPEGDSSVRFTYTGGLNRTDFYAVAADQFLDAPVIGEGSGSFRTRYALDRDTNELPRDAHSIELETLGELGVIGMLLLLAAGVGIATGAWRSRRLGSDEAALSAIALALLAAFAVQTSVDWFTSFPALVGSVLFLAGAAAGLRGRKRGGHDLTRRVRMAGSAPLVLLALVAMPLSVAEKDTFAAATNWRADQSRAFDRLDRAATLNPFADTPLLVEAQIARELEQTDRALEAIEQALDRQPDEWRSYVIAASVLADDTPKKARAMLSKARALNPLSTEVQSLQDRLDGISEDES